MADLTEFHLSLADPNIQAFLLGFAVYALLLLWMRLAARWVNWFPLAAKLTRLTLYAAVALVVYVALTLLPAMDSRMLLWVGAGAVAAPILNQIGRMLRPREKVRRGARLAQVSHVNRLSSKLGPDQFNGSFSVGDLKIPRSAEPYHFFVVGSTGSGKSVAITRVLDHLEARGDIALVVDSGGEFASRYYKAGRDHILNPFDERCVPWSPTAELAGPWDAEALAKSMIPDGVGESKEWNGYAQTLVTSVLRRLMELDRLSIKDLLYYVQAAPVEELEPLLAGTAAAAQLVSEKTFGSIRTIASNYLATYAYLSDSDDPFSIASFIRRERPGFLFMTYRDDQMDSLRNMISCALDVAARTILALEPNSERRVWLIIDEFASIGRVQSIEAVATKARKVGGCLLVGLQSVSQLKDRYGEHGAQTILSCLSSWLVLRCSDADTAEYVSRYIGETEVSRMTRGESSSAQGGSDSLNEQIQTQRAVLPIELQGLANLEGYFKLAGNFPITRLKLAFPQKRKKRAAAYATRDFKRKPMLSLKPTAAALGVVAAQGTEAPVDPDTGGAGQHSAGLGVGDSLQASGAHEPVEAEKKATDRPAALAVIGADEGPEALESVLTSLAEGAGSADIGCPLDGLGEGLGGDPGTGGGISLGG